MPILNIAGYKFVSLTQIAQLREVLLQQCDLFELKGTILLSEEGINLTLAGKIDQIESFKNYLKNNPHFADMTFRESYSRDVPFKRMKIKLKKEIITMRHPEVCPEVTRADSISPKEFKQWLDEHRDITVLDTRNDYEYRFGAFNNAVNLHLKDFCEFPEAAEKNIDRNKPIVMYCTGGIRCEKAALHLKNAGFSEVYQLDGGILNYFAQVGAAHYDGECFVFDERVSLNANLEETGVKQCLICQGPVKSQLTSCESCLT